MYNLTVATAHTFYVGSGQWLVHNAGSGGCPFIPKDPYSPESVGSRIEQGRIDYRKEIEQTQAADLGFDKKISPDKVPFDSHGQPVYFDGSKYITRDVDGHNVTNGWKMFDRKGNRIGTYDSNLNYVKK